MGDHKTIRIPKDDFNKANARRKESGQTWAEYLTDENRGMPDADDVAHELTARINIDASGAKDEINEVKTLVEETQSELDTLAFNGAITDDEASRIISSLETIEERTGRLERSVEELQR